MKSQTLVLILFLSEPRETFGLFMQSRDVSFVYDVIFLYPVILKQNQSDMFMPLISMWYLC